MPIELNKEALDRAFRVSDLTYEEARNQEFHETGDGDFFDALDEAFGIVPGTDKLIDDDIGKEK